MTKTQFPTGWDEKRTKDLAAHYEGQSEDEAAAEDSKYFDNDEALVRVPHEILPQVRALIAKHKEAG